MTSVTLRETAVINLNGSGTGTARVGPLSAREVWHPQTVSVSANSNPTNEAQCAIYVGESTTQSYFRDQTFTGSSGDSTDKVSSDKLKTGQYVWAVWTNGDANVQAVLTVVGTKDI
jgi:hypothetical protein